MAWDIESIFRDILEAADGDVQPVAVDSNGDGYIDQVLWGADFDHDGVVDQYFNAVDINGDGYTDGVMTVTDLGTDGFYHDFQCDMMLDMDGDNQIDMISSSSVDPYTGDVSVAFYGDSDGDHIWEAEQRFAIQDGAVYTVTSTPGQSDTYLPFDPDTADMSRVLGNPEAYMDNWHLQETSFSCTVAAQQFLIEELLGVEMEEVELRRIAVENGWLTDGGTSYTDMGRLLEYMGLDVRVTLNNDFQDLCDCLSRGNHPDVFVNADELWHGESEDNYMPGRGPNHSIQVIGVDLQDPANPMVILNDSGVANGCGAMVPAELFMDAWEDSGCQMIEAYV